MSDVQNKQAHGVLFHEPNFIVIVFYYFTVTITR